MEFAYQNKRAYICTMDDFEDIKAVHLSRKSIHGSEKTIEYNARFPTVTRALLRGMKPDHYILGCRNLDTGTLVSYSVVNVPKSHPFTFIRFAETLSQPGMFLENNGLDWLFRLTSMLSEADNKFDMFFAVKHKSFVGATRQVANVTRSPDKEGQFDRYIIMLHSVIKAGESPVTPIEKHLLPEPSPMPREKDLAIVHFALKPELRLQHYKNLG